MLTITKSEFFDSTVHFSKDDESWGKPVPCRARVLCYKDDDMEIAAAVITVMLSVRDPLALPCSVMLSVPELDADFMGTVYGQSEAKQVENGTVRSKFQPLFSVTILAAGKMNYVHLDSK